MPVNRPKNSGVGDVLTLPFLSPLRFPETSEAAANIAKNIEHRTSNAQRRTTDSKFEVRSWRFDVPGERNLRSLRGSRGVEEPAVQPVFVGQTATTFPTIRTLCVLGLVLASLVVVSSARAAGFADAVISYNPGTGFAKEFGTGLGFTNATAVLGEPSRVTPGQFGGPVDPFNPPYLRDQILSIGAGGSLTVRFDTPILNLLSNSFSLDFLIFGNAGFTITNGNFSGGGITDGSLFGANSGTTRVSVSADNINYFQLNPSLAPTVDGLFPIDGSGNFNLPVNPVVRGSDFSGRDLTGVRSLYAGSGGGTGFDLSWAQDASGRSVNLPSASFIRIDVSSGASEIDGFAAVPEPAPWLLCLLGSALLVARPFLRSLKSN